MNKVIIKRKPLSEETRNKIRIANTGYKHTEETKEKLRIITSRRLREGTFGTKKGSKLSEEHRRKLSESHKGKIPANKGIKMNQEFRDGCRERNLGKKKGNLHWNWKGGITPENVKIRSSIESDIWRNGVFARDGYICQKYGTKGGKLVAHHILNFSTHPELRFALDNGITLSEKAHKEFHKKYGRINNNMNPLLEFLNKNI